MSPLRIETFRSFRTGVNATEIRESDRSFTVGSKDAMKILGVAFSLKTVLTVSAVVIYVAPCASVALIVGAVLAGAVAYRLITGKPASNILSMMG